VRNFDVVIALDGTDPRLRSGMSASARLELERLDDVLIVPRAAVFSRDGATVAYVLGGGEPETRPITVGRLGLDQAVITSGLRAGERVALQDPAQEGPQ
jgi:multidrug efflux pump subunit AcrA (membrane-fusion protein)